MRRYLILLACACLIPQLGCTERQPVEQRTRDVESSGEQVRREAGEAAEATDRYVAEKSEEFKADLKRKLDELDVSIEKLKARAHELKEEARPEWERQMARLDEARQRARQELAELRSASREAWQDAKPSLDAAWENVRQAYDDAAKHFEGTPSDKPNRAP
ncbi:MAG: hypothetical protein HY000_21755 [Planctomycetes bacterium]|nr:hypothetical protein [Planctomycetota bacterium]